MPERRAKKAQRQKTATTRSPRPGTPRPRRKSSASRRTGGKPSTGAGAGAAVPAGPAAHPEKLHKLLADLGYGSRRQMEQWIADGRIEVDGEVAHVGQRVAPDAAVTVDGRPLARAPAEGCRVLVLNKRPGVITTRSDPEGRPTVFDELPPLRGGRWISVGRLDVQTAGLLVVTNDGALAHRMMHPSTGLDREYAVRVNGRLDDAASGALLEGVDVDGELLRFSDLQYYDGSGHNHWYHVVLLEGRNREVRRLFEAAGFTVSRLKRVRYGPVVLPSTLRNGRLREMGEADLKSLYALLRLPLTLPRRKRGRKGAGEEPSLLIPYPELPNLT